MTNPVTNPIGYLQEFVQKMNVAPFPKYVESGVSGPDHSREFTFQCIYDGFEVSSSATTKKQAKTEAAKKMVNLLEINGYFEKYKYGSYRLKAVDIIPEINTVKENSNQSQMNGSPVEFTKNPISLLQEYCQRNQILLPRYDDCVNVGGKFICECILAGKTTFGEGACKKTAKTKAALKMCENLNLFSSTTKHSSMELNIEENVASKIERSKVPPLPVIEITHKLHEFNLDDDCEASETTAEDNKKQNSLVNETPVETLILNDSVVEIEPLSGEEYHRGVSGETYCKIDDKNEQITSLDLDMK